MATSANAAPVPVPAPALASAQPPLSPATAAAGAHAQHANGGGAPAECSQGGGGSASTASNPPVERSISTTSVLGGNGARNGAMTAELANAGEGAMYARMWHGMDKHDFINLECSVRHLADHVVELCGLPAGTLVDLCTERGRLLELPTRFVDTQPSQVLVERADDVLRRGYVYLPVLVAAEAPPPPPHTTGSHPNHHHHGGANAGGVSESRPSSSRSPIGSRHGTAGAGKGRRAGAGGAPDAGGQSTAPTTAAAAADAGPHSGNGASGTGQQEDWPSAVAHNAALLAAEAAHTALNTTVTTVATAADDVKIYYHVLLNPSVLSQHLPSFELQVRGAKVSAKTPKSSTLRRGNSRK